MSKNIAVIGVVSYNVWRDNDNDRVRNDLKFLMNKNTVDIICVQEGANFFDLIVNLIVQTPDWQMIKFSGRTRGGKQNILLYRESTIQVRNYRFHDLHESGSAAPDRWMGEARLLVRSVNRHFDIFWTHLHSHVENSRWWRLPRQTDYRLHVRKIANKADDKSIALAVADWNVNFRRAWVNRVPFFPTQRFKQVNMFSNWSALGKPKMGTKGRRLIDAMFLTRGRGFRFMDQRLIELSSDHRALLVKIAITK